MVDSCYSWFLKLLSVLTLPSSLTLSSLALSQAETKSLHESQVLIAKYRSLSLSFLSDCSQSRLSDSY